MYGVKHVIELMQTKFSNPKRSALIMGLSFLVGSIIPIMPYFFILANKALVISSILSVTSLFAFGAIKTIYTKRNWFKSGIEMTFVGAIAGFVGYLIGSL